MINNDDIIPIGKVKYDLIENYSKRMKKEGFVVWLGYVFVGS